MAIKFLFETFPGDFPAKGQAEAFTWPIVWAIIGVGLLGLLAERSLCFPDAFDDLRLERRGQLLAAATGLAYEVLTLVQDRFASGSGNPLTLTEWPPVAWPWSVPFYTFGAIFLELLLRLGLLCLLVWLVHVVILQRRRLMPVFWVVNALVSFYETMPATLVHVARGEWGAVALTPLEPLYWTNLFEGWLLLRFGWFAPIVSRFAFYLVWHIIYGGLGPYDVRLH